MPVLGADYELARRERNAKAEPNRVVMGGEHFTLLPVIPLAAGFDLVDAPEPSPGDNLEAEGVRAIATFLRLCLIDEDQPRFDALLARREDAIEAHDLLYYGALVSEVYTGRPMVPSTGSTDGRRRSGRTSKPRGRKAT